MSLYKPNGQRIMNVDLTESSLGEGSGLSKSSTTKLKKCYPNGPQHHGVIGPKMELDSKEGTGDWTSYSLLYKTVSMIGHSSSDISFTKTIDMSYGSTPGTPLIYKPPILTSLPPVRINNDTFENTQGTDGSTISASGVGPNINVYPSSILERKMVDVKPTSLEVSPDVTSMPFVHDGGPSPLAGESDATAAGTVPIPPGIS